MIVTTAPGKAVLSGEYVVLQDAPAISAAVGRRVRVSVSETPGEFHCIMAPGYRLGNWLFRTGEHGELEWQQPLPEPSAFSLVEEIWKCLDSSSWPALALVVDTQEFFDADTGQKLGLGSSAAVAVALTAALRRYASLGGDDGRMARDAHDRFQGGCGSGVDVATSLQGGLIEYRRAGCEVRRLGWPEGLHYRYLWSGRAAATADKLARLGKDRGREGKGDDMKLLGDLAEDVAGAWSRGDAEGVLKAFPAYIDELRRFGDDLDLGIFDAGHGELSRVARDSGLVYKPCGAGGGDIGIVLAACEHDIDEFCIQAQRQNFRTLDVSMDEEGLAFVE